MKYIPQYLTAQSAFIQGVGLLGTCKTVTLPKIDKIRQTITQGGFERSVDTGLFKAMEADITLSEHHPVAFDAMQTLGALIVIKGSMQQEGRNIPVVATFTGSVDVDDGNWETGKEAERKVKIFCDSYSLEVDGVEQVHIDAKNMIAEIMGVDHMAEIRKHVS